MLKNSPSGHDEYESDVMVTGQIFKGLGEKSLGLLVGS